MDVNYSDANTSDWGHLPEIHPGVHYIVGSFLLAVGTAGVLGNSLVLFVFTRFRRLRGSFSAFIINLALADLCTSLLHSMAVVSSFRHRWVFGQLGCMLYAAGVGQFGLVSIVTLAAIAVERYWVITAKPLSGSRKMTKYCARKVCVLTWLYCLAMSLPPLFGWSRYVPEGFYTSCSWDYTTRTLANRAFYVYLLTLGFLVPVSVITYCYVFIMIAILAHGKEMRHVKANGGGKLRYPTSTRSLGTHTPSTSTVRTAEIILVLVVFFLISWTPYAVVTFIGQFGQARWLTPWVTALPAFFAKASVVYNPIIYGLSHPHFRSSVKQYISACTTGVSNTSTLAGSQREPPGRRGPAPSMESNSGRLHAHHAHFRCFPHHAAVDRTYHSEPDPRGMTVLLERPLVTIHWQEVRGGPSQVMTSTSPPACISPDSSGFPMITSEAMVTTGSQTSTRGTINPYDIKAKPCKRRWLAVTRK